MDKHKHDRHVSTKSNISPSSQIEEEMNKMDYNTNERILSSNVDLLDSSKDDIINIVLVGETGVGKSTFINAFINYLSFDRLDQAQLNKPNVIIPVQSLMTVGDNFEERIVKFIDINNCSNEDFNNSGQSVTQDCKSYLFSLNDGTRLCLIDTPGFGDTRGFCQDQINMEKILKYLNHLKHINAICFLLKPNSSRLNIFFRSCFTQLIQFLGPNISHNILFCFTNSRSTFYSPGDTAPLIKSLINSLSIKDIIFKKENTFCFDNQSFRYLVARQNQIPFTDEDKRKCEKS
jgi:GTP-binding protein EngB required for normal cell division